MTDRRPYQQYAEYMIRDALFGDGTNDHLHRKNVECYDRAKKRCKLTDEQEECLWMIFSMKNDQRIERKVTGIAEHFGMSCGEIWNILHSMEQTIAQERGLI